MKEIQENIKKEIIELHNLFTHWFTGNYNKADLQQKLTSRFHKDSKFITTKGETINYENLMNMFQNGYGKMNKNFKIVISEVDFLQEIGDYALVNYLEWQTTDPTPQLNDNYTVRKTTLVISKEKPFKWLHIHETMLPTPKNIIDTWNV